MQQPRSVENARHPRLTKCPWGHSHCAGWLAHGLVLVLSTLFWWPTLVSGKTMIQGDSLLHGLPLVDFLRDYLHGGESPLWVHQIYGGHPLFAESQGGFLNPLNLFAAAVTNPVYGANLFHYLCMLFSGWGMLRLCRVLGSSWTAATLGAIAVTFSPTWILVQHNLPQSGALCWAVWTVCAFEYWRNKPTTPRAILLSIAGALLVFSGYPQTVHATGLLILALLLLAICSPQGRQFYRTHYRAILKTLTLAALVGVGLAAVQLLPLLQLAGQSHRSSGVGLPFQVPLSSYASGFLYSQDGLEHYWPVTGSLLVCMLASACVFLKVPWRVKTYLVACLLLLLLGMRNSTDLFRLIYAWHLIPGMHFFRTVYTYEQIGIIGVGVLSAFSLDALSMACRHTFRLREWTARRWLACLAFALVWAAILYSTARPDTAWIAVLLACTAIACVLFFSRFDGRNRIALSVLGLLMIGVLALRMDTIEFHDASFLHQPSLLQQVHDSNMQRYKMLNVSPTGAAVLYSSHDQDLPKFARLEMKADTGLANLLDGTPSMNGALALALHNRSLLSKEIKSEARNETNEPKPGLRLIDILGVRYIVATSPLDTTGFSIAVHQKGNPLWLLRNRYARPLVQIYHHAEAVKTPERALQRLRTADRRLLVVVDKSEGGLPSAGKASDHEKVRWHMLERSSGRYVLGAQSDQPYWLYINDANYPGWRATIDGSSARVWTAQILGKAVHVPAGRHRLVIRFQSDAFRIGCLVSIVTLAIVMLYLMYAKKRQLTDLYSKLRKMTARRHFP